MDRKHSGVCGRSRYWDRCGRGLEARSNAEGDIPCEWVAEFRAQLHELLAPFEGQDTGYEITVAEEEQPAALVVVGNHLLASHLVACPLDSLAVLIRPEEGDVHEGNEWLIVEVIHGIQPGSASLLGGGRPVLDTHN